MLFTDPHLRILFAPEEGDAPDEGGGESERTFSQADVDRIIQKRLKDANSRIESFESKISDFSKLQESHTALQQQLEEIGKTEAEKQAAATQREREKAQKKLSELQAQNDTLLKERDAIAGRYEMHWMHN